MTGRLLDAVPLNSLSGVGASQAGKLAKLGLVTVQDLLLHLPLRYEDRTQLYAINDLLPNIYATVEGEVLQSDISFGRKRMLTCQISDGSGILTLRFFNFNAGMKNSLSPGKRVTAYGEVKRGQRGAEIIHPEYRIQGDHSGVELQETLTPVYSTTEGIRQATLRNLTDQALDSAGYLRHCRTAAARVKPGHDQPERRAAHPAPSAAGYGSRRSGER